jgi:hypothetical protein
MMDIKRLQSFGMSHHVDTLRVEEAVSFKTLIPTYLPTYLPCPTRL